MRLRTDVSLAETDYGAVLLDERSGTYWELNPTGRFVLSALLDGTAPAAIATRLTEMFDVDGDRATADVTALMDALDDAGLMRS